MALQWILSEAVVHGFGFWRIYTAWNLNQNPEQMLTRHCVLTNREFEQFFYGNRYPWYSIACCIYMFSVTDLHVLSILERIFVFPCFQPPVNRGCVKSIKLSAEQKAVMYILYISLHKICTLVAYIISC